MFLIQAHVPRLAVLRPHISYRIRNVRLIYLRMSPRFVNSFLLRAHGLKEAGPLPSEFSPRGDAAEQERCRAAFRGARGQDLEDEEDFDGRRIEEELVRKFAAFPDSGSFPRFLSAFVESHLPAMILEPTLRKIRENLAAARSRLEDRMRSFRKTLEQRQREMETCQVLLSQSQDDPRLLLSVSCEETVSGIVERRIGATISKAAKLLSTSAKQLSSSDLNRAFNSEVVDLFQRHVIKGKRTRFNALEAKSFTEKIMRSMAADVVRVLQEEALSWLETTKACMDSEDVLHSARRKVLYASMDRVTHHAQNEMSNGKIFLLEKNQRGSLDHKAAGGAAVALGGLGVMLAIAAPGLLAVGMVGEGACMALLGGAMQWVAAGCELGKGDWSEESWLERFSKLTEALMKWYTSMLNQGLKEEIQEQLRHLHAVDMDGVELDALEQMWQKASTAVGHLDALVAGLRQSPSASTSP